MSLLPLNPDDDLAPSIQGREEVRLQIADIERAMLQMPQAELSVRHYFAHGLYAREITIPAGTLLTGAVHLAEHLNIISHGDISVVTEFGSNRITAPATLVSPPGTKRIGYAHTETIWTTVHANPDDCQDVPMLEARLVVPNHEALTAEQIALLAGGS